MLLFIGWLSMHWLPPAWQPMYSCTKSFLDLIFHYTGQATSHLLSLKGLWEPAMSAPPPLLGLSFTFNQISSIHCGRDLAQW